MTLTKQDIIDTAKAGSSAAYTAITNHLLAIQAREIAEKQPVPDTITVIDTPQEHVEEPEIPASTPPRIGLTMSFLDRGFCKPETALRLMKHSDRVFPVFFIEEADIATTSGEWVPITGAERSAMRKADSQSLNVADWWRWFNPLSVRAKWYFQHLRAQLGPYFDFGQPIDVCIDVEGFYRGMYNARLRDQSIRQSERVDMADRHAYAHLEDMKSLANDVRVAAHTEGITISDVYWYGTMRAATNNPTTVDPWPIISSSKLYHPTQAIYPRADWDIIAAMEARIAFLHSETHWQGDKRYFIRPYTLDEEAVHCYAEAINAARPVEIICWDNMRQPGIGADWQEDAVRAILEATE